MPEIGDKNKENQTIVFLKKGKLDKPLGRLR